MILRVKRKKNFAAVFYIIDGAAVYVLKYSLKKQTAERRKEKNYYE